MTTKFNIGDQVWYLHPHLHKIQQGYIHQIDARWSHENLVLYDGTSSSNERVESFERYGVHVDKPLDFVTLYVKSLLSLPATKVFATRDELITSLETPNQE